MSTGFDWFQPGDLPAFFKALRKSPHPAILVGGQSLTFWVDFFNIPISEIATPYLTQDADVLATKHDALIVAKELHGTCAIADFGDATPNTAIVTYIKKGHTYKSAMAPEPENSVPKAPKSC